MINDGVVILIVDNICFTSNSRVSKSGRVSFLFPHVLQLRADFCMLSNYHNPRNVIKNREGILNTTKDLYDFLHDDFYHIHCSSNIGVTLNSITTFECNDYCNYSVLPMKKKQVDCKMCIPFLSNIGHQYAI